MTSNAYEQENFALPLPISQAARTIAQSFAKKQPNRDKAQKVLFNTIAVMTVNYYLDLMGVTTNVNKSDSWNPVLQLSTDVADLEVPDIGRLECRPMLASQTTCYIPAETWGERIAHVVVLIDESLLEAKILGFCTNIDSEELTLSQLQPPETLTTYLEQSKKVEVPVLENLNQWFKGVVESSWQTVEALFSQNQLQPAYAFRSPEATTATRRAKLIDLGIQIANQPVMLIVEINPTANQQTNIRLQLHPTNNQVYLQPSIMLTVLDESGNVFLEAQSRSADNYIQLQFSGDVGERFSVKVGLDGASITEHFII